MRDPRFFKRLLTWGIGTALLIAGTALSIKTGSVDTDFREIAEILSGNSNRNTGNYHIIWNIRLPRILIGMLAGINLAIAGALLQGILRNPMADPGIIGVSAGAGLFAVVIMILAPEHSAYVPIAAFAGALTATMIVYLLSWKGGVSPLRLILAGVAVAAFFGAGMTMLMVFHSDKVQGTINWMAGGFQGRSWNHLSMILPYTIVGAALSFASSRYVNILMLGDDAAKGLGLRVEAVRLGLIALSSLLAASAVSVAGLLGFVGLIVPHTARLIVGSDYKYLLPASAIFGAILIAYADTLARTIFKPVEIPVGVLMAFTGAPFFLYLLRTHLRR